MNSTVCLFLLACLLTGAQSRPDGAPNSACYSVGPDPAAHRAVPQDSNAPYVLTGLPPSGSYTPEMSYRVTLRGNVSEMFQGFLVVAMNILTTQRVGSFTSGGADSKTTCSDMRGITHTSSTDKSSVSFTWTAPSEGTGGVEFQFSVAQTQMVYWSNQPSAFLQEETAAPTGGTANPTRRTNSNPGSAAYSSQATLALILLAALSLVMMLGY